MKTFFAVFFNKVQLALFLIFGQNGFQQFFQSRIGSFTIIESYIRNIKRTAVIMGAGFGSNSISIYTR